MTTIKSNSGNENVANDLYVQLAGVTLSAGTYLLIGYTNFQSTSSTGSRISRFVASDYTSLDLEVMPNTQGYTQIKNIELVTLSSSKTIYIQAKQLSGNTMSVSGQIKAIKLG